MTEKPKRKNSEQSYGLQSFVILMSLGVALPLVLVFASSMVMLFGNGFMDTCSAHVTDTVTVQMRTFLNPLSQSYSYVISRDGESWHEFHSYASYVQDGFVPAVDCSGIYALNDDFIYILPAHEHLDSLLVTSDGGRRWHTWTPRDINHYPEGFQCNIIESVNFYNVDTGGMSLRCNRYQGDEFWKVQNLYLLTTNGGISWDFTYE